MHVNNIYKAIGQDRRQYRKYAPWIFLLAELVLVVEILYAANLFISLGNIFLIVFLGAVYFRVGKLLDVLERQKKLKPRKNLK